MFAKKFTDNFFFSAFALSLTFVFVFFAQPKIWAFEIADTITQELGLALQQEVNLHGLRETNPTNTDNWQNEGEWDTQMRAGLDWYLGFSDRVTMTSDGTMNWFQRSGPYGEENSTLRGDPVFTLNEALVTFNLHELGTRISAGKTLVKHGSAVIFPVLDFLVKDLKKTDAGEQNGLWMSGVSCNKANLFAEFWFSPTHGNPKAEPLALFHTAFTLNAHRLGLLYYHNGAHIIGAYYSGQIGESLIPYAEVAASNHRLVPGLPETMSFQLQDSKSVDATCGLSYAPNFANLSLFFEYRFRSSGYNSKDWKAIESELNEKSELAQQNPQYAQSYYSLCGNLAATLPYFNTPVHSVGLRLQNARQISDLLDYSVNAFYLAPDGVYLSAQTSVSLIDRLQITLEATSLLSLADAGEMAWWQNQWQIQLAAKWTLRTYE